MHMEALYLTKLVKMGSSHGIIIPKQLLTGFKWERGDSLVFGLGVDNQLFIRRLSNEEIIKMKPHDIFNIV